MMIEKTNTSDAAIEATNSENAHWLRDAFASRLTIDVLRPGGGINTIDWESFAREVETRFGPPAPLKDHLIREAVNDVTKIAKTYRDTGQLRSRVLDVLLPLLKSETPQLYTCDGKGGNYAMVGSAKPAGPLKDVVTGALTLYADTDSGQIYCRFSDDAEKRIIPVAASKTAEGAR